MTKKMVFLKSNALTRSPYLHLLLSLLISFSYSVTIQAQIFHYECRDLFASEQNIKANTFNTLSKNKENLNVKKVLQPSTDQPLNPQNIFRTTYWNLDKFIISDYVNDIKERLKMKYSNPENSSPIKANTFKDIISKNTIQLESIKSAIKALNSDIFVFAEVHPQSMLDFIHDNFENQYEVIVIDKEFQASAKLNIAASTLNTPTTEVSAVEGPIQKTDPIGINKVFVTVLLKKINIPIQIKLKRHFALLNQYITHGVYEYQIFSTQSINENSDDKPKLILFASHLKSLRTKSNLNIFQNSTDKTQTLIKEVKSESITSNEEINNLEMQVIRKHLELTNLNLPNIPILFLSDTNKNLEVPENLLNIVGKQFIGIRDKTNQGDFWTHISFSKKDKVHKDQLEDTKVQEPEALRRILQRLDLIAANQTAADLKVEVPLSNEEDLAGIMTPTGKRNLPDSMYDRMTKLASDHLPITITLKNQFY